MEQNDGWCTRARVGEEGNKQPFDTAEVQRGQAREHNTKHRRKFSCDVCVIRLKVCKRLFPYDPQSFDLPLQ